LKVSDLNKIANGEYWQEIVSMKKSFKEKEKLMIQGYLSQFKYFKHKCQYPIKEKYKNIPKYRLIYGTRHDDGILLMNDIVCKVNGSFLWEEFGKGKLFELLPDEEEKNFNLLRKIILEVLVEGAKLKRKEIIVNCLEKGFVGKYSESDYKKVIKNMTAESIILKTEGKIDDCLFSLRSQ